MSKWDEMRSAYVDAEQTIKAADSISVDMARMIIGRLRKVDGWTLIKLKRELKNFNMQTQRWK